MKNSEFIHKMRVDFSMTDQELRWYTAAVMDLAAVVDSQIGMLALVVDDPTRSKDLVKAALATALNHLENNAK